MLGESTMQGTKKTIPNVLHQTLAHAHLRNIMLVVPFLMTAKTE